MEFGSGVFEIGCIYVIVLTLSTPSTDGPVVLADCWSSLRGSWVPVSTYGSRRSLRTFPSWFAFFGLSRRSIISGK